MNRKLVRSADSSELLTLDDVKAHIPTGSSADLDAFLTEAIVTARQRLETILDRSLLTQTWVLTLDQFPTTIVLPRPPLASITSIQYRDTSHVLQTLSSSLYDVLGTAQHDPIGCGYVIPADGQSWPSVNDRPEVVIVTFIAGASDPLNVPRAVRDELLRMIDWQMKNRGADTATIPVSPSVRYEHGNLEETS